MMKPQEIIEKLLLVADYEDCIVLVSEDTSANLRWANNTLTTNGVLANRSVTVIAFVATEDGMAAGSITKTDVAESEIAEVSAAAKQAALAAGAAEDAAPLLKDITAGNWDAPHNPTGPEVFSKVAPDLGEMFNRANKDGIELFGYAEHVHATTWIGSKGGIRVRHDQPSGRVEMTGKSHNRTRSTWEGRATRDFSDLDMKEIDAAIRKRLQWQANKIDLPAGKYDALLPAGAVGDLVTYMVWSAAGKDAFQGQSVFSDKKGGTRVGEKLSNVNLNLYSDPNYPGLESTSNIETTASSPFVSVFDNGYPVNRFDFLENGVLKNLINTRASAKQMNADFVPISDNIIMTVAEASATEEDLIKSMKRGLLITCLWYIRMVDPVTLLLTGLTRDGVYLIENGEVVGAVNNFRWNESPVELLNRIVAATPTSITQVREWADYIDRTAMPAVIFKDFNMSTVSKAS
jgi:predicted Zn-dependent protease